MTVRSPLTHGERPPIRGGYIGPELPLRGLKAMLQPHPKRWRWCVAQFDDRTIRMDGTRGQPDDEEAAGYSLPNSYLGFGWHEFRRKDFRRASTAEFRPPPKLRVTVTTLTSADGSKTAVMRGELGR